MAEKENPRGVVADRGDSLSYERCKFSALLPKECRYTPAHFWIAQSAEPDTWRVGCTKFAARMLGELVEMQFDVKPGDTVDVGQVIGRFEGLKTVADIYCAIAGTFLGGNSRLATQPELALAEPHGAGWLYEVRGTPDPGSLDVSGYIDTLDATIDKLQES